MLFGLIKINHTNITVKDVRLIVAATDLLYSHLCYCLQCRVE